MYRFTVEANMFVKAISEIVIYTATLYALMRKKVTCLNIVTAIPFFKSILEIMIVHYKWRIDAQELRNKYGSEYSDYLLFMAIWSSVENLLFNDHQMFFGLVGKFLKFHEAVNVAVFFAYRISLAHIQEEMSQETQLEQGLLNISSSNRIIQRKSGMKRNDKRRGRTAKNQLENIAESKPMQEFMPKPEYFFHASLYGHKEVVRYLLANFGEVISICQLESITGFTAFHLACAGGHLSVVQQMMSKYGEDTCNILLNRDGQTGLECATESGRKEVVQAILNTISLKRLR